MPYKDPKLTTLLNVRIDSDAHAALMVACEANGIRHADLLRDLIRAAIACHAQFGSIPRDIALTQKQHPTLAYYQPEEAPLAAAEADDPDPDEIIRQVEARLKPDESKPTDQAAAQQ